MAVRKLKEELNFDRSFTDVCKVYVNGKELDISGLDTYDQVGDVFAAECRRTPEFEEWIREYMNSFGDPLVDDSDSVEEVCRLFAKELDMDLHDSEPGEFYVDGSGNVFDSDVRVEIFEESVNGVRNNMFVKRVNESGRLVNGKIRELSPEYDSSKSFYGKAHTVTDADGNETLYSYNTPVVRIVNGEVELLPLWDSSATTLRHVKEFSKQNGFEAGTKQSIARAYKSVSESKASKRRAKHFNEDFDDDDPSWSEIADDPFIGYDGLGEFGEVLSKAASVADDINYWLTHASNAFNNNYSAAIEAFSGPDDAKDATEYMTRIARALNQVYSWIPDTVRDLADIGYESRMD